MFMPLRSRVALLAVSTASAAIIAVASLPVIARAADDSKHQKHMMKMPHSMGELMKMDPEHCMMMMDANHKGYVTKEEFMKFQEQLWTNMDKNRNNQVDRSEFEGKFGGKPAPGGG